MTCKKYWYPRSDSNRRDPAPEAGAFPLDYEGARMSSICMAVVTNHFTFCNLVEHCLLRCRECFHTRKLEKFLFSWQVVETHLPWRVRITAIRARFVCLGLYDQSPNLLFTFASLIDVVLRVFMIVLAYHLSAASPALALQSISFLPEFLRIGLTTFALLHTSEAR